MRHCVFFLAVFTLVIGASVLTAAPKAPSKPSPLVKVQKSIETLFKNADGDKSGTLTQAELKKIQKPLTNRLNEYSADKQLLAVVAAERADKETPDLTGNEAVTADEFRDFVMGTLHSRLMEVNTRAANPPNVANQPGGRRRSRDDDETSAERRARERREDERAQEQRNAQQQMRAAQIRDSSRPTPPPIERAPSREPSRGGGESKPKDNKPGNKR